MKVNWIQSYFLSIAFFPLGCTEDEKNSFKITIKQINHHIVAKSLRETD